MFKAGLKRDSCFPWPAELCSTGGNSLFVVFMDLLNLKFMFYNIKFRVETEGFENLTGRCFWNVNWRSGSTVMSFVFFLS